MKLIAAFVLSLLLVGAVAASPSESADTDNVDLLPAVDRNLAEKSLDQLSHLTQLWCQAHERKDKASEICLENEILRVIKTDIFKTQNNLLHHQKTLRDSQDRGYGEEPYAAEDDPVTLDRDLLARLRSMIAAKEALATSVLRSKDFSHKYRLLSDYQYLLRSQLGMPKVRLANRESEQETK